MSTAALTRPAPLSLVDRLTLTKTEAARAVGCSTRFLGMEEAAGRLKVIHVGRKWLVRPSDLEAWLDARANEPRRTEPADTS